MISVIIADDQTMFREGLASLLAGTENIRIAAQVSNGAELLAVLRHTPADLILLDVTMPVMNGIEAAARVKEKYPHVKIIMVTMYNKPEFIFQALSTGAQGYILKDTGIDELRTAITTVYEGQKFYSQSVTDALLEDKLSERLPRDEIRLSDREREVLSLIAREYTSQEISQLLFLSYHTIESHRKNLIHKLNVRSVAGLVKYAIEKGYV